MIKLTNVSFTYQNSGKENVKNINLHIKKGECVLISGRSGCGKTTILRLINGLIPHFYMGFLSGNINAHNMDILNSPMHKISEKIGMVYQNPRSQFFNVDTDSELAFGLENLSYPREKILKRIKKTITDIEMEHLTHKGIFELSGGEKQKVAFGSIYAMQPEIYLLDEPSANLDAQTTSQLKQHLMLLKKQGKTIIITEHRLCYLKNIIDRVIYMDNGEIVKDFTHNEFYKLPDKTRESLGLRAFDLKSVEYKVKSNSKMPALEVSNINTGYKKNCILKDINLQASKGDIIAIVGRNGVGKSTFAETLCGIKKPFKGTIFFANKPLTQKQLLKHSYMVMQDVDYQLFADSVLAECIYGQKFASDQEIDKILDTLSLLHLKKNHPATLSGGQKQRLAVAISMICKKEILIFDEPTSGLDLESMLRVTKLIESLSNMGKIIFIITHDYEFIAKSCTRVIQIADGKINSNLELNDNNKCNISKFFI